ncbi:hypothetical protein MASR2M15_29690 [Anaerolineales bacterium]
MIGFIKFNQVINTCGKTLSAALIRAFEPMANSLAYAYLNDQHLAEEAAQEAFITVYKRIDQLQEPQAFPAWFKRIVITHCDRLIRGKRVILEDIDVRYDLKNATPGPEETLVEKQLNQNLHVAIDRLPEHERDITDLFYMQGHSQKKSLITCIYPSTQSRKDCNTLVATYVDS